MAKRQTSSISTYLPLVPKIEIINQGNWERADRGLSQLQPAIQKGYDKGASIFTNKLLRIIRKAVATHTPPAGSGISWPPLSRPSKGKGIYYNKGDFYRAIGIYHYRGKTLVGMPSGNRHYSGLTLNQLAIILEYGNEKIPARPLWRPSVKSAGGVKELRRILLREIRRSIMSRTGLKANQIRGLW